ncbi:MAG: AAA family ATPase [Deltaproteobacteria bacterium]
MELSQVSQMFEAIEDEIRKVFVGQDEVLSNVLVAMLARGHVLLEGVPGVGKTLLVRTLGHVLGCHFRRVQFTPDLMPSDVTGSTLYNTQKGEFEFKHGPVFTHILLADEVNRAPAKTQSAMLESMAERSVTVDGVTHPLPAPYFVLATQNPLESAGTYALPEAQLDRFLFKVLIRHPAKDVEEQLLRNVRDGFDAADLEAAQLRRVTSAEGLVRMQQAINQVTVDDKIISYIADLVGVTRRHRAVQIGASPRAAIALLQTSRVEAAVQGRNFVVPDDVKTHGAAVLRHRIILQPDAEIEGVTTDEVVASVLHETQVPGMGESHRPTASAGHRPAQPQAPAHAPAYTPQAQQPQGHQGWSAPPAGQDQTLLDANRAPSAPARPAHAPSGSAPARPAGMDPDTIPPQGVGPLPGGGGRSDH